MMTKMILARNKKSFLVILISIILNSFLVADDWVLTARKFVFSQEKERGTSEENLAVLIPQLITEQIAQGLSRTTSNDEMLDRSLESCLTERNSLFLQLSSEVKKRDAIFLLNYSPKKEKRKIALQEKKIAEIEKKIDENFEKCRQYREDYERREKEAHDGSKKTFDIVAFFSTDNLKKIFTEKKAARIPDPVTEPVKFYKNDSSVLFDAGPDLDSLDPEDSRYERAVLKAKIKGVISGSVTVYGKYFSVTASLHVYPGKACAGTITDAGSTDNAVEVARNIAEFLIPLVTNDLPVEIYFDIEPEECARKATVSVDGDVYKTVPEKLVLNTGLHSIGVNCEGYDDGNIVYNFKNSPKFLVKTKMKKAETSKINLTVMNPEAGVIFANGEEVARMEPGNPSGTYESDSKTLMGYFRADEHHFQMEENETEDEDGNTIKEKKLQDKGNKGFYFYLPEEDMKGEKDLVVTGKPFNADSLINRRRIWTYISYTALVFSVPPLLYTYGRKNAIAIGTGAFAAGTAAEQSMAARNAEAERQNWARASNICQGITIGCGIFFGINLVRYLVAANSMLPKKPRKSNPQYIERAKINSMNIVLPEENDSGEKIEEKKENKSETNSGEDNG